MSSGQQHDYNYLENETVLLQKEQLIKQNSRSARLIATGKFTDSLSSSTKEVFALSSGQQHDYNYLENETVLLQKEQLIKQNSRSARLIATGKFLERSFFVLTASGIFLLLLEGGQVHHDWAKILLLIISIALLLSLIFSVALLYSSDILHHRFWKCPNCGGELPLLTMPRTFLTKQRSVQNPDLYDLCVKKQIRCVRLTGSNLLIPSR